MNATRIISVLVILLSLLNCIFCNNLGLDTDGETFFVPTIDGQQVFVKAINPNKNCAIIFVHGVIQSHAVFQEQYQVLKSSCSTVLIDLFGAGYTTGNLTDSQLTVDAWNRDISAVINALGANKVILVGWSLGGVAIQKYVNMITDTRVKGMVLISSNTAIDGFVNPALFTTLGNIYSNPSNNTNFVTFADSVIYPYQPYQIPFNGYELTLAAAAALSDYQLHSFQSIVNTLDSNYRVFTNSQLKVLILQGSLDNVVYASAAAYMKATSYPDARVRIIEGGSHLVIIDHKSEVNYEIKDWIKDYNVV